MPNEADNRILRVKQVSELTGLCVSSIYDKLNPNSKGFDAAFPTSVRLGAKAVGWKTSSVMAWIESRPYVRSQVVAPSEKAA